MSLMTAAAHAAPADFKDRIPSDVTDMKTLDVKEDGDAVLARFEGKAGRAMLSILPAPGQAKGETGYDPQVPSGQTVPAQRVLLTALQENLEKGTSALGESYDTSQPKFEPVEIKDESGAKFMDLSCASVLRQQSEGGEGALMLLDRICAATKAEDVVLLRMTAPIERKFLDPQNNAQLVFAGEVYQRLLAAD